MMQDIKMDFEPHTHSVFSDGKGTMEENIIAGIKKGLNKVAITDHSHLHMAYGVKLNRLDNYLKRAYELKKNFKDEIDVLVGMEFNLCGLDGEIDIPTGYESEFEIKLIGVHKLTKYTNFKSILYMMGYQISEKIRYSDHVLKKNTEGYIKAIENNKIDIIAHPLNITRIDMNALAKACEKTDTLLEINTRHPDLTKENVKDILSTKANFILGSDAHRPDDVGECINGKRFIAENEIPLNRVVNAINA